jgi:hypothetical protein
MSGKFSDDRETDLFGNPVRARHGRRGRPPLQLGPEDRDKVEAALARGWSAQRTADAVGISLASLKRYFRAELKERDVMRDRLELAANAKLIRAALEGNMTAMKQLRELMDRDALQGRKRDMEEKQREADAAGLGMGKKEAAQRAAEKAIKDDGWDDLLGQSDLLN